MGSLDIYFFSLASVPVTSMKDDMAEDKKQMLFQSKVFDLGTAI